MSSAVYVIATKIGLSDALSVPFSDVSITDFTVDARRLSAAVRQLSDGVSHTVTIAFAVLVSDQSAGGDLSTMIEGAADDIEHHMNIAMAAADWSGDSVINAAPTMRSPIMHTPEIVMACPKPLEWCTHSGTVYKNIDCDGDGLLDHYCEDLVEGHTGVIGSASSCADTWPSGTCASTTDWTPATASPTPTPTSDGKCRWTEWGEFWFNSRLASEYGEQDAFVSGTFADPIAAKSGDPITCDQQEKTILWNFLPSDTLGMNTVECPPDVASVQCVNETSTETTPAIATKISSAYAVIPHTISCSIAMLAVFLS
jgi:hypothetical protein